MTRENKIGLLVGLAFLLVVGILLSEHITGATDRPAAPLADAGHGIRTGMGAPGAGADEPARLPEPSTPIPTAQDLTPRPAQTPAPAAQPAAPTPPSVQVTVVAPGGQAPANPVTHVVVQDGGTPPATVVSPIALKNPTDPFANDPIAKVAAEHGEAVVPAGNHPGTQADAGPANTTAAREVQAQSGDTLSRLAARLPGGNSKSNRDAIVQLNPVLQKDPNHVLSGHKYLVPGTPTAAVTKTTVTTTTTVQKSVAPATPAADKSALADAGDRVYVVKSGDTLSKIASTELGSKAQVATLKAMNADVLKGGDVIKVDMKLKLPAKAAATKQS